MVEDGFRSYDWAIGYSTSDLRDGRPTDILHDFYLPALTRARRYDRVAGYFRSTSLAAASEGYTAFLRHGGVMRLIAGADLAAADVAAILAGDAARLEERLSSELDDAEDWPEPVRDGVSLLARMVAAGQLEVRVALRVHAQTHVPLAVDATDDGYVHEKWFVLEDAAGDRLYGGGSLNESRTALALNAENIDISCDWWDPRSAQRVQRGRENFDRLWRDEHPAMRVLPLPEAVREHLVRLKDLTGAPTEIDGTVLAPAAPDVPAPPQPSLRELLTFSLLRDAPRMPGGVYIGMYSAPVAPWPHQEMVSRRLVETWPYAYLLCDEVGLGKTIEAALALRSLMLAGRVRRVLIAAPASLTAQWQSELYEKALLPFTRSLPKPGRPGDISHEAADGAEAINSDLYAPRCNIVSTGLLARRERQQALQHAADFDAVLVDEAHYARRSNPTGGAEDVPKSFTNLYRSLSRTLRKKTKSLWLATATPMQIHPIEVYDLLRLTNRVGPYEDNPALTLSYFGLLEKLARGVEQRRADTLQDAEWQMLGRNFRMIEESDPALWSLLAATVIDRKNERPLQKLAAHRPANADVKELVKPLFSASPLARVMMRHTRALLFEYQQHGELQSSLAHRKVQPLAPIAFTAEEAKFYAALTDYTQGLARSMAEHGAKSKQVLAFLLNFLQLRFASSMYAIEQTLARRKRRVEATLGVLRMGARAAAPETDEDLQEIIDNALDEDDADENDWSDVTLDMLLKDRSEADLRWEDARLGELLTQLHARTHTPSKLQRLLGILSRRMEGAHMKQTVIFTRFFDSLLSIRRVLEDRMPRLAVGTFSGGEQSYYDASAGHVVSSTREGVKAAFLRGDIELLLCTDAAAEGLNLQTADMLINFDMGWNPMKVEQRIGRIDRIGQTHDVIYVYHMIYAGSIEEKVYCTLAERLKEAGIVVGAQQVTLLPVKPEDFRDLAEHPDDASALDKLARRAKERLQEQQKAAASMELSAAEQYDIYQREHARMKVQRMPARVEDLWQALAASPYLQAMGGKWQEKEGARIYDLPAFSLHGTSTREACGSAQPFLTWGEHDVDAFLQRMTDAFDAAEHPNVVRITVGGEASSNAAADHLPWQMVGYAVQTTHGSRLVTAYEDLAGLELSETPLASEDIARARQEPTHLAMHEADVLRTVQKVLEQNARQALLQASLTRDVAIALLEKAAQEGYEKYKSARAELASHARKSYPLTLPAHLYAGNEERLLFPVVLHGDNVHISAPPILWQAALALCDRISSDLKSGKNRRKIKYADQTCEDILSRLRRKQEANR